MARTPTGWYLTKFDHVLAATKDVETFVSSFRDPGVVVREEEKLISEIAEPRHGKVRRIINTTVAHHKSMRAEPFVRELCHQYLDPILERGQGELVAEFITPVPINVISHLTGVPAEDWEQFHAWTDEVVLGDYPRTNRNERGEGLAGAHPEFCAYIDALIAERRASDEAPDDLVTRLITTEIEGPPAHRRGDPHPAGLPHHVGQRDHPSPDRQPVVAHHRRPRAVRHPQGRRGAVRAGGGRSRCGSTLLPTCSFGTAPWTPTCSARQCRAATRSCSACRRPTGMRTISTTPTHSGSTGIVPRTMSPLAAAPTSAPGASLARLEGRVALEVFLDRVATAELAPGCVRKKTPVFWANGPDRLDAFLTPEPVD